MDKAASAAAWASIHAQYDDVPWSDSLAVKSGTKVMLTRNSSVKDGLVNGATGVVVGLGKRGPDSSHRPIIIRLDATGREHAILPVTESADFGRGSPAGPWTMIRAEDRACPTVARLTWTFWPLQYGWALSYNKVQGKTLTAGVVLAVSPGLLNNMFYTGMTRSPRLSRVWIVPDLTVTRFYHRGASLLQQAIRADPRFLRFDAAIREQMRQDGGVFDAALARLAAERRCDGPDPPAPSCVVCQSERANVVFLPCAHVAMCQPCDEQAARHGIVACCSCRGRVEQRVKLFYAN